MSSSMRTKSNAITHTVSTFPIYSYFFFKFRSFFSQIVLRELRDRVQAHNPGGMHERIHQELLHRLRQDGRQRRRRDLQGAPREELQLQGGRGLLRRTRNRWVQLFFCILRLPQLTFGSKFKTADKCEDVRFRFRQIQSCFLCDIWAKRISRRNFWQLVRDFPIWRKPKRPKMSSLSWMDLLRLRVPRICDRLFPPDSFEELMKRESVCPIESSGKNRDQIREKRYFPEKRDIQVLQSKQF